MKESGLNYFYNQLNLDTGSWGILYTFEEGAGSQINSISGGQPQYSGVLSSSNAFWVSPGSGFFSGNYAQVANASGLQSTSWTQLYVYQKINANPVVLFSSQSGSSGYSIGITNANKPYFESFYQQPVAAASLNNYSSKNAVAFTYQPNFLTIAYYDFNSKAIESETFSQPFEVSPSDDWKLGIGYTGCIDYFAHLTDALSPIVMGQWFSGLFARPTGVGYNTETICSTGITGYQDVVVITTGVTGYQTTPGGDEGQWIYTGQFPLTSTTISLTGILTTGLLSSGISGVTCDVITGSSFDLLEQLTGYAASFGMEKVQLFGSIENTDIVKVGLSYQPFYDIYNWLGVRQYSGYLIDTSYDTGIFNLFMNGVALGTSGWSISGSYLIVSGADVSDAVWYDLKSGDKLSINVTGGLTGFVLPYSGQEIFLNGVNLISGRDFVTSGSNLTFTALNTGIDGLLSEYPIVLPYTTGIFSMITGAPFWRDTSAVYLNGVRQQEYDMYTEGALFDLLSGNQFNNADIVSIYSNSNLYWGL